MPPRINQAVKDWAWPASGKMASLAGGGGVALVDVEGEVDDLGFIIVQGDVEVAGVHQPHHLPVQAGQNLIDGAALFG
ncbi:hypothetical protein JOS77_15060 [Chromobacterium haemolyticum]|nr:hypothetical protein JOS77_15060 [Chromobacterium haemolyticum]